MTDKLGPSVTYLGAQEGDESPVEMAGVAFKPGEAVNLVEKLGEGRAQSMLAKLAGNPFFKVEGGPERSLASAQGEPPPPPEEDDLHGYEPPDEPTLERSRKRKGE